MLIVAAIGAALVLSAWGLFAAVRRWDRRNAILAAAPALPIRLVNVFDDVWVRGWVLCDAPVAAPYFGHACVHYAYTLEEHVRKTRRVKDRTETYYVWETRRRDQGHAPFLVVDDQRALHVDAAKATFEDEMSDARTVGRWRHSCRYTPASGVLSVVGVVNEDKTALIPHKHVPLLVTSKERQAFLEAAESAERWGNRGATLLLFAGFAVIAYGLLRYRQIVGSVFREYEDPWNPETAVMAAATAAAVTGLFWAWRAYNTLVILRTRARERWSHIDVQLRQRYDLLPSLIEVVRAYAAHEQGLLEHLAALRAEAVAGGMRERVAVEADAARDIERLLAVVEAYPRLQASEQYGRLADELTALEEKIAHARGTHNDAVTEHNTAVESFPKSIVALLCGFKVLPLFRL